MEAIEQVEVADRQVVVVTGEVVRTLRPLPDPLRDPVKVAVF